MQEKERVPILKVSDPSQVLGRSLYIHLNLTVVDRFLVGRVGLVSMVSILVGVRRYIQQGIGI